MLCGAKIWHDHFKIGNKCHKSYCIFRIDINSLSLSLHINKYINQIDTHVFTNVFIENEFFFRTCLSCSWVKLCIMYLYMQRIKLRSISKYIFVSFVQQAIAYFEYINCYARTKSNYLIYLTFCIWMTHGNLLLSENHATEMERCGDGQNICAIFD